MLSPHLLNFKFMCYSSCITLTLLFCVLVVSGNRKKRNTKDPILHMLTSTGEDQAVLYQTHLQEVLSQAMVNNVVDVVLLFCFFNFM